MSECPTPWKRTYATLVEAEDAYHRTPPTRDKDLRWAFLLPYWCEPHGGYHLGHFDVMSHRAFAGWGRETYNIVNAYKRPHRKRMFRRLRNDRAEAHKEEA